MCQMCNETVNLLSVEVLESHLAITSYTGKSNTSYIHDPVLGPDRS
jgi:hypothetical protein